jgi:hypothetical protein
MQLTHFLAFAVILVACGGSEPAPAASPTSGTPASASSPSSTPSSGAGAKEGESCGDGVMGAPNIQCATGLVCDRSGGTAPGAPPGAQGSARPGTCKKQ